MDEDTPPAKRKPGRPRLYFTDEERKAKQREWSRKWIVANPERNRESKRQSYLLHLEANRDKVREQQRLWFIANKEHVNEVSRRWRAANPGRERDQARARYATDPERGRAKSRAWYAANPEKASEMANRFRKANPEWFREAAARRRASDSGVGSVRYKNVDIFERDGWICQLCGEPVDPTVEWPALGFATIDHVIPYARGGWNAPDNVQLAHFGCNCQKHDRMPD